MTSVQVSISNPPLSPSLSQAGIPPIHTPLKTLEALPEDVKQRLHVVHVAASAIPEGSQLNVAKPGVENTIELEVRQAS